MRGVLSNGVRLVAFGLAFAATAHALLTGLDRAGVGSRRTLVDSVLRLRSAVGRVARQAGQGPSLAMLGDSHLAIGGQGDALHRRVGRVLRARGEDVSVVRVADHGLSLLGQYCLADAVAAAGPGEVVLALNLAHFSPHWQRQQLVPCLALLGPRRWLEAARLPLHREGVSLDRLLFYGAIGWADGLGLLARLTREQARVALAWEQLADAIQSRSPWPDGLAHQQALVRADLERSRDASGRATAFWARRLHGPALDGLRADDPALRLLASLLSHYREAGVRVLVFANPINVEHLRALGLYPAEGLAETLGRAEAVARRQGARWLDLHDLVPDAGFGDHMDHLDTASGARERLAQRLADALR